MPSNHFILCHSLLLLPSIFPSIRVFYNESILHIRWSKYKSFSFSISLSKEYSGLISFRMNLLELLAVQFSLSVVSNSLRPHELQHARPPCPSPTPEVHSSRLILCCPLLLLPPIPPSIRVFSNESALCMSGQSIGVSDLASVLPMNTQN